MLVYINNEELCDCKHYSIWLLGIGENGKLHLTAFQLVFKIYINKRDQKLNICGVIVFLLTIYNTLDSKCIYNFNNLCIGVFDWHGSTCFLCTSK